MAARPAAADRKYDVNLSARRKSLIAVAALVGVGSLTACVPSIPGAPTSGPSPSATVKVTRVVDGDTLKLSNGQTVRMIGIDTPEKGQCGFAEASARLNQLVGGQTVATPAGARDDVDRYGRVLRYVETAAVDAGQVLINEGLAHARYDGRDGYGTHPRQDAYVAADAATVNLCEG